ncbi:uncharacterized protein [Antedon mediterranea]|uniref:uncharacterized protein n=1 Tax=Antedon mediterranea TaxID=105859 RepID=UPI003AF52623
MKYPFMTTSIEMRGGKRSPLLMTVSYLAFIIGSSEVFCYRGTPACGTQDGCTFDAEIGILNCKSLKMQTIPLELCPEVKYLDMRYNYLVRLSTQIYNYHPNLEILNLGATGITTITPDVFKKCDSINFVYLDTNEITTLKRRSFDGLTSLQYLYLSANKLSHIKAMIFDPLNKTLLYLDLSHNAIMKIEVGSFQPLTNLKRLFLQKNQLTHINSGMLRGLQSLTHLYLSNNQIKYIPHNTFKNLPNLTDLKLGHNPMVSIHNGALGHLAKLSFLDLMSTQITTLQNISCLFSKSSQLETFYISGTTLVCDASFESWRKWYKGSAVHNLRTTTCVSYDDPPVTMEWWSHNSSSLTPPSINKLLLSQSDLNIGIRNNLSVIVFTAMMILSISFNI